ncbi:MAG: twin-arginine translocase TatA/TatE family subunit [Actinomycetota bacterium]|jgi:sec-independent protein translocase protein TatA|nr:twin-arginine translocase TatA/TatE family subunit [Actinomycetota bacterium]
MIPNLGGTELIILLVIILLLFGAKRIPELARGLGSGMREFKRGSRGEVEAEEKEHEEKNEELTAGEDGSSARTEAATARANEAQQKQS